MITLKMISEKFNAWRRYRDAVRELSQFLIMNCAISAFAAATSKTSCAARVRAERMRKAPAFSMRRANSAVPSTMTMSTEAASAAAPSGSAILRGRNSRCGLRASEQPRRSCCLGWASRSSSAAW